MALEKRRFIRLAVLDNAFAALWPALRKVGRIRDISISGLAFEYISENNEDSTSTHVEIFFEGNVENSFKLPCHAVYDIPVQQSDTMIPFEMKLMKKRCGIQFELLSQSLQKQLKDFLDHCATGSMTN